MARLMGLQFKVIYRIGKENCAANALSRLGHLFSLQAISEAKPLWLQEVLNSYATDVEAQALLTKLSVHNPDEQGYSLQQGLIKHKDKVWIGHNSALQTKLISALHSSAIGGHSGISATYHRIKQLFGWKGMKKDVENFVRQCLVCQQAKHEHIHPGGLLQPLPMPQGVWQDISMDFVEGLPLFEGSNTILVIVDRFTKYRHFIPLRHPFTAQTVAKLVLDNVVKLHGLPKSMLSDRDRIFNSLFWKNLFQLVDTKLLMSSSYHPQTDGQTERVNQCLDMYLRCVVHDSPKQWKSWLSLAELWYNSSFHTALGCSPFKALYGHEPNLGLVLVLSDDEQSPASSFLQDREAHFAMLKQHLAAAQIRMKLHADRNRTGRVFQVGDKVLLKWQPYVQQSVISRPYPKLAHKFFGPFEVMERIGAVAYKLALPAGSLIHPVFHVSQLKPYTPNYTPVFQELPKMLDLSARALEPEAILERRLVKKGNHAIPQVLVKWHHIPVAAATWEDYHMVKTRFPDAVAWGQATLPAGEDVMTGNA